MADLARYAKWRETRDAEAFAEIVSLYSSMVFTTCKRILQNPADAEEVTQECFIELSERGDHITHSLGGWLHTLATRRALDRLKAETRRRTRENHFAGHLNGFVEATWNDIQTYIDEAIESLPPELAGPIRLRFLEGQTQEAAAEQLHIARTTLQYRLARGIELIRNNLKSRGILISAVALTTMLVSGNAAAHAIPATLTASLGKLALAASFHPIATTPTPFSACTVKHAIATSFFLRIVTAIACIMATAGSIAYTLQHSSHMPPTIAAPAFSTIITGKIALPDGSPAQGAVINLLRMNGPEKWHTIADDHGAFSLNITNKRGLYLIIGKGPADQSTVTLALTPNKDGPIPPIMLKLGPANKPPAQNLNRDSFR